jgi:transposase
MEIVKRNDDLKGFVVLPRRRVVERTFSWSAETGVSPRTSRTLPKPWSPSLPSPPSSQSSGGLPGRRS